MSEGQQKLAKDAQLAALKQKLRSEAKARRRHLIERREEAAARVAEVGVAELSRSKLALARSQTPISFFKPGAIVAGFYPLPGEFDVLPLMRRFREFGCQLALPVVAKPNAPLIFRQWRDGDKLEAGAMDIPVPPNDALTLRPDVLLVPFLLIDGEGYRLGYGGGFYDRTIANLQSAGPILTIAVGFFGQIVDKVPRDRFDVPVDAILTEEGFACFSGNGSPPK